MIAINADFSDSASQSQISTEFTESADQVLKYEPDTFERPCEPLEKNAPKHDAKLAPVHIVFASISIPHQRAKQHFDQQGIAEDLR